MFMIGVRQRFSAAHRLDQHPGKCSRLHGHTWEVEAVLRGADTGESGMLVDFDEVAGALETAVSDLDHSCLNDLEPFASAAPTAENVARLVFERLDGEAARRGWSASLDRVTVWESADKWSCFEGR